MGAELVWSRTPDDLVAEVDMVMTNWNGSFLVVEGPSDECFFSRRVLGSVYLVQAGGRLNVERAIDILDADSRHRDTRVLGIVDEDYDWLIGYDPKSNNVVKTDPRDLEGMLLRADGLGAVLAELADSALLRQFIAMSGKDIRASLTERAEFFGRVRMVNSIGPRVCLKAFKPQRFCRVSDWSYDQESALTVAVTLGVSTSVPELRNLIERIEFPTVWHAVRGHDLVDILVGGLMGVLGTGNNVSRSSVEMILRQAMTKQELEASTLFSRLRDWEKRRGCAVFA